MERGLPVSLVTTISVGPAGMSIAQARVGAGGAGDGELGGGDVEVAGADDLGDGRDGLGAEGEGGDGLRAADRVELVDAGEPGGGEGLVGRVWGSRRRCAGRRRPARG